MLTSFGKLCKKIRVDNNQVLYDMANVLGVKPSFLSSVENGKKNVPDSWCEIIREEYGLNEKDYESLLEAKELSKTQVKLNLVGRVDEDRALAFSFARTFDGLSGEQKKKIYDILNE